MAVVEPKRPHGTNLLTIYPKASPCYPSCVTTRRNYNTPNHAHELTFSCYRGIPFLSKDTSRHWLANAINEACTQQSYRLWAYVLMPEHVHLLVWPQNKEYDIADLRHAIKAPVARQAIQYIEQSSPTLLAKITRQRGQRTERLFWQPGGGYDRNIYNTKTLRSAIEYIHMNPVRRGLVHMPEDWAWSSAHWYRSGEEGPCKIAPLTDEIG